MTDVAVALDARLLDQNIARFHQQVAGRVMRAHFKAHRTVELAARQFKAGAAGVAVHTARTAIALADVGVRDVVVAWPWREAWRWPVYLEAARSVERFAVHVDDAETIAGLGALAAVGGAEIGVRLDLRHLPDEQVLSLARLVDATAGVRLDGVTAYSGAETRADIAARDALGQRQAERLVRSAESIRADGIDCPVVSAGGTPTALGALRVEGVTEIVAGAYATLDAGMAEAGVCALEDVAVSVAAERVDLLAGCTQPWAPDLEAVPTQGRLLPGHICPLAKALMHNGVELTLVDEGRVVDRWLPRARADRG
ncbi:alanine racemase [Kribbella sp. NPDC056345]|uniref:alanine racemase n=1 Tax=Kribbella sp. NPDC056345 TaxID=3345789 RepID=UPI0035E1078C